MTTPIAETYGSLKGNEGEVTLYIIMALLILVQEKRCNNCPRRAKFLLKEETNVNINKFGTSFSRSTDKAMHMKRQEMIR